MLQVVLTADCHSQNRQLKPLPKPKTGWAILKSWHGGRWLFCSATAQPPARAWHRMPHSAVRAAVRTAAEAQCFAADAEPTGLWAEAVSDAAAEAGRGAH